jgi:hypothetical protein
MQMQHVFERDCVAEVDYLIGDDSYERQSMYHRRERWGIVAYNPKKWAGLAGLLREMLGRGAKHFLEKLGIRIDKPAFAEVQGGHLAQIDSTDSVITAGGRNVR